jgi:hypothetical protein
LRVISLALFSASIAPLRLNRFAKNLAPNARFPGIAVRRREERARKRPVRVGFGFTCQVKASDFGEMAGIALFAAFASSCLRRSSAASGSTPLHAAARKGLLCPAYCLMPDHLHLVWMGLRHDTDQRNGLKFLRSQLGRSLRPGRFQHQPHDHVLKPKERQRHAFSVACAGVRPSSGAATFASSGLLGFSNMPCKSELAAPGDGRTPVIPKHAAPDGAWMVPWGSPSITLALLTELARTPTPLRTARNDR